MMRVPGPSARIPFLVSAVTVSFFTFPRPAAAQAVIKVSDTINLKFGFLLQPQADFTQDAASDDYQKNLFLRRVRFMAGGQITPSDGHVADLAS